MCTCNIYFKFVQVHLFKLVVKSSNGLLCSEIAVSKSVRKKNAVVSPLGVQQPGSLLQTLTVVLLQKPQFTTVFVVKLQ